MFFWRASLFFPRALSQMDMRNKFPGYASFQVRQSRRRLVSLSADSENADGAQQTLNISLNESVITNDKWFWLLRFDRLSSRCKRFSSQSVSPISASQLADVRRGFIRLSKGKLKWKCSETFWFPEEKKKRRKVLKNYYLEKEANSAGIKALGFFFFQLFVQGWGRHCQTFSQERYAHAYCFTPQSITAARGKCQERFLWTGGGFICARRCQTTSEHSLTFGELNKDFYLHAKFTLGRKTVPFIFPGNRLQTRRTHGEEENSRP